MYEPKAITKTIKVSSRASIKIHDDFYTFEYTEERDIPDIENVNIEAERQFLWNEAHTQVDKQIEDTIKSFENN